MIGSWVWSWSGFEFEEEVEEDAVAGMISLQRIACALVSRAGRKATSLQRRGV